MTATREHDLTECEDCSVNGLDCQTHGRAVAVPVIDRLLGLLDEQPESDCQASDWLAHQREQYEEEP